MGEPTPESAAIDAATDQEMAYALGRDEERAAVVAALRTATTGPSLHAICDWIERGEHRTEPT